MLRWLTAGESHGPELIAVLEGMPAGLPITMQEIRDDLARRKLGYGRGSRMKFEQDELSLSGGVVQGRSIGGPIAIRVGNTEWAKWVEVMSAEPTELSEKSRGRGAALTRPRPGHADLVGMQKYGFDEARPVLERASARETAARVALGAVAKAFLRELGVELVSHTVAIGPVQVPAGTPLPVPGDVERLDADPLRCFDEATSALMVTEVDETKKSGDTVGGIVEVIAYGLPAGLGSYVHWDRRIDSKLAAAIMGIQAIKGVEFGDGFETTRRRGSVAHDELHMRDGKIVRETDRAGGIEGGMTTGQPLRVRAGMKPIATVPHALPTIDIATGEQAKAHHQRSDVCAVPAAGVVAEAMVALTLADAMVEKFGGDSVAETKRNLDAYLANIPETLSTAGEQ
ncbi:chorismate synthase [Leucobacter chinensis]|uniref:chorismate synthase n=1 Tax=Leucobacter chinensis TaxID=2851010 RepID=UPI001C23FE08|nr:chorismate synthase [Leucobacter chinensis]